MNELSKPLPARERSGASGAGEPLSSSEMLRFLDFLDELESEARLVLPIFQPDAYRDIMTLILRRHLEAKRTTLTSLASATSVPYATAIRRIEDMVAAGLIVRRPRTRTGKSYSLHPSASLIEAWYDYARRIKGVIGKTLGLGEEGGRTRDYYFGGSYLSGRIIPLPSALSQPLALNPPLRVLVHADPMFMAMDALKRQFEHVFGISVQLRALSIDRLRADALKHASDPSSPYDIIACDLPWTGEFAERKVLMALDDFVAKSGMNVSDFDPAGWGGCNYRGQQFGIPVQTTPELLFYRRDIFEQHGLNPPQTTGDVMAAAKRVHAPGRGTRGIAWNAARGTALGHTFIFTMAAFGRPVLNLEMINGEYSATNLEGEIRRPMIDSAGGRAAAEYLRELLDYSPLNILSMAWFERVSAYAKGEVAMAYGYNLLAPYFEFDKTSPAYGQTGFLPHPRGGIGRNIAPIGGYMLGIPCNIGRDRLAGALQALQIFTSAEACKSYILNGSLVSPRFSVSADPEVRNLSSVIPIVDGMARTGLLQYWPRPPAPEIADIITICGEEVHDMLRGLKSVDAAITVAQNRADALMRAHGHY